MDDLISRNAIINALESKKKGFEDCVSSEEVKLNKEWNKAIDECISGIQMITTAYNVDKVVKQLYELGGVDGFDDCAKAYDNAIEDSIKVVKAGGVNG